MRPPKSFSENSQKPPPAQGPQKVGEGTNELVPMSQFPLITWQLTAHMAVCTQVLRVTMSLAFGFFSFLFFFFFLELLPKTLKIVKDAAARVAQRSVSNAHLSS